MGEHYSYRIDHDKGFAPNPDEGICTVSGCKSNTVEKWIEPGGWMIGIGGDNTGKSDKLIYAMEVEEKLGYREFAKRYPQKSEYLSENKAGENVLISEKFYYLGDKAIDLPKKLDHLIWNRQGCVSNCISDKDIELLEQYLNDQGFEDYGEYGEPNNKKVSKEKEQCGCDSENGCECLSTEEGK